MTVNSVVVQLVLLEKVAAEQPVPPGDYAVGIGGSFAVPVGERFVVTAAHAVPPPHQVALNEPLVWEPTWA